MESTHSLDADKQQLHTYSLRVGVQKLGKKTLQVAPRRKTAMLVLDWVQWPSFRHSLLKDGGVKNWLFLVRFLSFRFFPLHYHLSWRLGDSCSVSRKGEPFQCLLSWEVRRERIDYPVLIPTAHTAWLLWLLSIEAHNYSLLPPDGTYSPLLP